MVRSQLALLGDNGLTYCPTDTLERLDESRPFSEIWGEGRLLLALCMLGQIDDDPRWLEIGRRKIDRLLSLSRVKGDFRSYGYAAGDREVLERVDACYRWARQMGDPLIGYYTEWMPGSDLYLQWQQGNSVEICEVADVGTGDRHASPGSGAPRGDRNHGKDHCAAIY